jgi:hypothetical protein
MELNQRIEICGTCHLRKFSDQGIVCGLTKEKPVFDLTCPDYEMDERQMVKKKEAEYAFDNSGTGGFADEKISWRTVLSIIIFIVAIIRLLRFVV